MFDSEDSRWAKHVSNFWRICQRLLIKLEMDATEFLFTMKSTFDKYITLFYYYSVFDMYVINDD